MSERPALSPRQSEPAPSPIKYREGWEAALVGRPVEANPYSPLGSPSHVAWELGYGDAVAEARKKDER